MPGGRGKAGGVKVAKDLDAVRAAAKAMLGTTLVTHQTGPEGLPVHQVYVETGSKIAREIYLSLVLNREAGRIAFVASAAGGMDIEEVAEHSPEKIIRVNVHPAAGLQDFQCRQLAFGLGLSGAQIGAVRQDRARDLQALSGARRQPGRGQSADRHRRRRSAGARRQDQHRGQRAVPAQGSGGAGAMPRRKIAMERKAAEHELNYVSLDGNIACMVNGAGLAMATMDLIQLHGGKPANFLDVGGGATKERVAAAFKLILSNPTSRAILINIFGGIVRCDMIAEGIIAAVKEVGVSMPVIVRLEGTNAPQARELLAEQRAGASRAAERSDRCAPKRPCSGMRAEHAAS